MFEQPDVLVATSWKRSCVENETNPSSSWWVFELKSAVSEELCVQVCQLLSSFRSFISSQDHSALSRGHSEFDYEVRPDPSEFAEKHLAKLKWLQVWPHTVTWDGVAFRCWFGLWNPYWFSNWWGSWSNVSTPAQLVSRFSRIQHIQWTAPFPVLFYYTPICLFTWSLLHTGLWLFTCPCTEVNLCCY